MISPRRARRLALAALVSMVNPLRAFADQSAPAPSGDAGEPSPIEITPLAPEPEVLPQIVIEASLSDDEPEPTPVAPPPERTRHVLLQANTGALFGSTGYGLAFTVSGIHGRSQLDYSLDTITAGVDMAYLGGGDGNRPWSLRASFNTNLSNPLGTLLDRDWVGGTGSEIEFSHTDSSLTGRIVFADLSARIALAGWQRAVGPVLDLIIGYRHESMSFDGWGVSGWQLSSGLSMIPVHLYDGIRVIHYDTQKLLPHVGLGMHGRLTRRFLLDAEASIGPDFSIDRDDHVVRYKLGEATSSGVGMVFRVAPQWIVAGGGRARADVVLGLDLQLRYLVAWGRLHQHYYADDPSLPGDQRAVVIPDVDFTAATLAASLRATVDVRF